MTTWTLVLFIYAGSVAILEIPQWQTQQECMAAGTASKSLVAGTTKELRFVCLPKKSQ